MIFLNSTFNKHKISINFGIITELFNSHKFSIPCISFSISANLAAVLRMMSTARGSTLPNTSISSSYLPGATCPFCSRQVKSVVMEHWSCDESQNRRNWAFHRKMFLLCRESLEFRKPFIKVSFSLSWSSDFLCLNLHTQKRRK